MGDEFTIVQAATGNDGVSRAVETKPDLILLDLDLPDINGREVCRQIREKQVAAPIIMLTAADSDEDTVKGLDAGANDYVAKPFKLAVLLARIRAQLRSHEQSEGAVFHLGAYEFRPSAKMLVDSSQKKIRLTEKETSILKYLYRAGEKPVARDELLTEVWGPAFAEESGYLRFHFGQLRRKLEADPARPRHLITEPGLGYRFAE